MKITCENCQATLKIPENKISEGRSATFKCPKCKESILVGEHAEDEKPDEKQHSPDTGAPDRDTKDDDMEFDFEDSIPDEYEPPDKTFEFIEDEGKTALICESDQKNRNIIKPVLDFMEYHITVVDSVRDAIRNIRYHTFDIIIFNENFGTKDPDKNGILIYLSRIPMSTRSNIFAIMITERFNTLDNMMTLDKSVDMIINIENMDEFEKILEHGLSANNIFYRLYMEELKNAGRI